MEEARGSSVQCCPPGTAMGWPSRAGQRAGQISAPRARLAAAGLSRRAARRSGPGPRGPGPPSPLRVPGPAGPGRALQVGRTSPRPGPRGPGPGSSSRADVAGSGRSWPRLALRHGSRTLTVCGSPRHVAIAPGGVRGPAGRCAAAGVVTWRPRGPAGDRVLTAGSTPAVVTATWGTEGDAVPPCSSAPLVIRWPSRKWHPVV